MGGLGSQRMTNASICTLLASVLSFMKIWLHLADKWGFNTDWHRDRRTRVNIWFISVPSRVNNYYFSSEWVSTLTLSYQDLCICKISWKSRFENELLGQTQLLPTPSLSTWTLPSATSHYAPITSWRSWKDDVLQSSQLQMESWMTSTTQSAWPCSHRATVVT